MKKLPVGIQSFSELRRGGYLYVDKTRRIHNLVTEGKYYFLSRPRRFGKSLLVSTMKELFSGSRDLFEGLWIEDQWDWEKTNPVLHIPFSSLGYKELGLERALHRHLDKVIKARGFAIEEESLSQKFEELILALSQDGRVVLLIDEYDKPIIDYLGDEIEKAKENQQVLKNFYSIIKDSDEHLRLVFITGVSKFSRVSIFSDLNNLRDITMSRAFVTMLGYTQEELEQYFDRQLEVLSQMEGESRESLLQKIKTWYNGYSWDGRQFVYNPFSILLLYSEMQFGNYWFATATPTFLIDLIKEKEYYDFDGKEVGGSFFESFQIGKDMPVGALLFQTGYLTIKKYDPKTRLYTLGYPNQEVKESMLEHLLGAFARWEPGMGSKPVQDARRALQTEDFALLKQVLNRLLYNIPYPLHVDEERLYHLLVHIFFDYIGVEVHSEVNTARGRADALVELEDKVYCFEFKLNKSAADALEQIKQRGYLDKYRHSGKKLIAVGVNFSTERREVDELVVEEEEGGNVAR